MYRDKTICVVVPAYNEQLLIARTLKTMPDWVDTIIVVDDGSTDNTISKVLECKAEDKRIRVYRHGANRGAGAAAKSAYQEALNSGEDIIALMDGDAQMDPKELNRIIDPVIDGTADYSKGNRFIIPIWKYFGNVVLSSLTRLLTGYNISDCQGNYSAISRDALSKIDIYKIYDDYGFPNDLLYQLSKTKARVQDVTTNPVYGIGEVTGIKLQKVLPRISFLFVRLFWQKAKYHLGGW